MPSMDSNQREDSDDNELVVSSRGRSPDEKVQIGEESEPGIHASVQQQNNSDKHDPKNKLSLEEVARLWEDLKAETGYASYTAYLEAYEKRFPYLKHLKGDLDSFTSYWYQAETPSCAIFDISNAGDSHPILTLHCSSSSGSVILSALRQPPATLAIRIVLWQALGSENEMVNALGLGLKIQPPFFQRLFGRRAGNKVDTKVEERRLVPDFIAVGNYLVTIAREYLPAYPDAPPVILITCRKSIVIERSLNEVLPFRNPAVKQVHNATDRLLAWMQDYVHVLQSELEKARGSIGNVTDLSFTSLTPLLHLIMFKSRAICGMVREEYLNFVKIRDKDFRSLPRGVVLNYLHNETLTRHRSRDEQSETALEDLYEMQLLLRRMIEDSKDGLDQLQRFMHSQNIKAAGQEDSSTNIEDSLQQFILEARRLETEIRDCLQLQTGQLALQESRKSIELSNFQVEEGKRG
ncbi:MAG: hypothetical protein Q9161_002478 [Pseudevernia consocians]